MQTLTDLGELSGCCWETASLFPADLEAISRVAAAHHPVAIAIDTCQRVERYALGPCDCGAPVRLAGPEAAVRLAEVASGLHSAVLGEDEVFGQVRAAVKAAPAPVQRLGTIAVAAARQLRREVTFGAHSGHLLDRALKWSGVPANGTLLVVGTGRMGKLVALRGRELGFDTIIVAGRSEPESNWIALSGSTYLPLPELGCIAGADVIVGCLGSSAGVLDVAGDLPPARRLLLDLGTPRNFAGEAPVPLLTIAQLLAEGEEQRHGTRRRGELKERLRAIVDERLALAERDSRSPVGELRLRVEQVRRREAERIGRLHPGIAPETVETITRSLVNQIFHLPSQRLAALNDPELAQALAELFGPEEPEQPS